MLKISKVTHMLKSKVLMLALLATLGGLLFTSGCVTLPNFSGVATPFCIADGSGGFVVVCQINHGSGRMTYAQSLGPQGNELWSNKAALHSEAGRSEGGSWPSALIASDVNGGAIFAWVGTDGFWAARLDLKGSPLWPGRIQIASAV